VTFAVPAAQSTALGVELRDVRAVVRHLADAEDCSDLGPAGGGGEHADRVVSDRQQPLGMPAGVDRSGEGELGEHGHFAVVPRRLVENLEVQAEVGVRAALLGRQGCQQSPRHVRPMALDPGMLTGAFSRLCRTGAVGAPIVGAPAVAGRPRHPSRQREETT